MLLFYGASPEYFSGDLVKTILKKRLSKKMGMEFTNYMCNKGFIDATENYLPKLTDWINDKITFWQTDLGSNLLQKLHNSKKMFCCYDRL